MSEFNLSENAEVLLDFEAMVKIEDFDMVAGEGFGLFFHQDKVKEFIKLRNEIIRDFLKGKIDNATMWGKLNKLAGEKLLK